MERFVSEHRLGGVWFAPLDVIVRQEPLRVRQPDLLFVSNENSGILGDRIEGGPDLVVEILSPSNNRVDVDSKLEDYAQIGVRECWIVSPQGGPLRRSTWKAASTTAFSSPGWATRWSPGFFPDSTCRSR